MKTKTKPPLDDRDASEIRIIAHLIRHPRLWSSRNPSVRLAAIHRLCSEGIVEPIPETNGQQGFYVRLCDSRRRKGGK